MTATLRAVAFLGAILVSCNPSAAPPAPPALAPSAPPPALPARSADAAVAQAIVSACADSIQTRGPIKIMGGRDCFYAVVPEPASADYVLELDARLMGGQGYGIWLRGTMTGDYVIALAVQYDPGAGGLKFLHYPETNRGFRFIEHACDLAWHHWRLVGSGGVTTMQLDGETVIEGLIGGVSGRQFGFRTWGSKLEVKNLVVTPVADARSGDGG